MSPTQFSLQGPDAYEATGRRGPGFWGPPIYRLAYPVTFYIGWPGSPWRVEIPAGYEFDLSAQWWIRWVLPQHHLILASAVHDYARHQMDWPFWATDLVFLDAMKACGTPELTAVLVWRAVRTDQHRD